MNDDRQTGAVEIEAVTKRFGQVVALDRVELAIPSGTFFSLLGPSGCGKTTLLRILAGLEYPDSGRIVLDGRDITSARPERRPFNIVFQRYALFPHLTVSQNIAFGLTTNRRSRPSRGELAKRVDEALALVGLGGLGARYPAQLSGGQAQRVAVARALIKQPKVLLLDEPLSALDRNVRHALREELLRIHRELGTTFLLVTHDQDEALSLSQSVALMHDGQIAQVADPETLYRSPRSLFAARFIGAGSFVQARVLGRGEGWIEVELMGSRVRTQDSGVDRAATSVQVLLRPEDLRIVPAGTAQIDGVVETCAFFGSDYELTAASPIGTLRLRNRHPVDPGSTVGVTWSEEAGISYESDPASAREFDPALEHADAEARARVP